MLLFWSGPLPRGRVAHLKGQLRDEHGATAYYPQARPADQEMQAALEVRDIQPVQMDMLVRAKQDASYWLGLVSFELGNYRAAIDYFATRTLAAYPSGPWTHGARYNLGRTYEAAGRYDEAADQYEADPQAVDHHGRVLRARFLRAALAARQAPAAGPATTSAQGPRPKSQNSPEKPEDQPPKEAPAGKPGPGKGAPPA
jgi:tetratricopeptide (TPR) repeat protein